MDLPLPRRRTHLGRNRDAALQRIGLAAETHAEPVPDENATAAPSTAEIRAWARAGGMTVPDRGRLRPEIHQAWRDAHPS